MFRLICTVLALTLTHGVTHAAPPSIGDPAHAVLISVVDNLLVRPEVRMRACGWLGRLANPDDITPSRDAVAALSRVIATEDEPLQHAACRALCRYGSRANEAVDTIRAVFQRYERFKGRDFPNAALDVLARAGERGVPALIEILDHPDRESRWTAAEYLGDLGPAARAAEPALRRCLGDDDLCLRAEAAAALVRIDPRNRTPSLVELLGEILAHEDSDINTVPYGVASRLLFMCGADAEPAIPGLRRRLRNEKHHSEFVLRILARLGPAAASAEPEARALLDNQEPTTKLRAAATLWHIRRSRAGLGLLLDAVEQPAKGEAWAIAVEALADMAPTEPEVGRAAWRIWEKEPDFPHRWGLGRVLLRSAVNAEVGGLRHDGRRELLEWCRQRLARFGVCDGRVSEIVCEMGEEAAPLVPALVRLLDADHFAGNIPWVLAHIGSAGRKALPDLGRLARNAVPRGFSVGNETLLTIARLNPAEADAAVRLYCELERLKPAPDDGPPSIQDSEPLVYSDPLWQLGPIAKAAVPFLVDDLRSPDRHMVRRACWLIWRVDPIEAARRRVPRLAEPTHDLWGNRAMA